MAFSEGAELHLLELKTADPCEPERTLWPS